MRKALLIISIVTLLGSVAVYAQKNKTPEAQEAPVSNSDKPVKSNPSVAKATGNTAANATGNASANAAGKTLSAGTAISGELQNTVDVRKSKVGDQVLLKTVRAVKQNGQTIVPKGSQLVGRITEIAKRGKNSSESRIGMIFDHLQGGSLSEPISASIVSITNAAANLNAGGDDLFDISGSSSSSASTSRGGSGSSGGLLGGGSGGGLLNGATSTVGGVANTATNTAGGVANTATNTVGSTTRTLGSTTQGIGNTVNGLRISGSASGSANSSTTISSGDKNLHIDKGATFGLVVNN